jgi:cell fate (sporulation/competence/biofilm development) regulator YlbF (YheA/YmcA/DUF963 family)
MQVKIQVIASQIETKQGAKSSYQQLEITYKDLDKNKVASKKVMSFAKPETVFKSLVTAKPTDVYDIELIKNEGTGYWDWTSATKSTAMAVQASAGTNNIISVPSQPATKGGWETPEERAKKQIYIVRQSSISAAVNALSVGAKTHPKATEVIDYARQLESFVFESDKAQAVASKDVGTIETMDEDLPY